MKNHNHKNNDTITTVTFLNRDQIDYLDKLGKDAFFKFGHKLSRARILSELVDLLMQLKIGVNDVDFGHETLWEGVMRLIKDEHTHKV